MRYPAAAALFALTFVAAIAAQGAEPRNLVLNSGAESGKNDEPSIWFRASVPAEGLSMARDRREPHSGEASLFIGNTHDYGGEPVANNWGQSLQEVPTGRTLALSAAIRSLGADAANVCVQCWDDTGKTMLAFASTPIVRGDQEWVTLRADPVLVPAATKSIIVRAALSGQGKAWFDDIAVTMAQSTSSPSPASAESLDTALKQRKISLVQKLRIDADQMVLKYLEDWDHGKIDNLAVANNDGGVRTLFAWPTVDRDLAGHRFILAAYSRDTRAGSAEPGTIAAHEIMEKWDEQISWKRMPKIAAAPAAEPFAFEPGEGWKFFEVTSLVREQIKRDGASHGIMLRFDSEDRTSDTWSGYAFVSREGEGAWKDFQPVLLVVK